MLERTLNDEELPDVQPYFMHFVLEAIYHCGLFEKYGFKEIRRWEKQVEECPKGTKESWGEYPGYEFDFSHAWAATPTYQLMSKITGLKIIEPGFQKISLKPNLFGLDFAKITIPTPYGMICCDFAEEYMITVPEGISYTVENGQKEN